MATIFYLIWIPLGILLIAGIIFLIVANPIGNLLENLPFGGPPGVDQGGFGPGGIPGGGQFGPPEGTGR